MAPSAPPAIPPPPAPWVGPYAIMPPPPKQKEPRPWWLDLLLLPFWIVWYFPAMMFEAFWYTSPPGVDMRMNDPMWVLYNDRGEVVRGRPARGGSDSDGSGMG